MAGVIGVQDMANVWIVAMPLFGAALPIFVTQISKDKELKAVGRSIVKYTIVLPLALVVMVMAGVQLFS